MSYNTDLQRHNAELRGLIEKANNLPDVGEGGEPTPTQEKTVDITENGTVQVVPDEGYALSKVTANVNIPIPDGYIKPSGELEITANGKYNVTEKASVLVDIPERLPILQEKTVTENGEVTPDSGYDGLSKVTVNVASSGGGGADMARSIISKTITAYSDNEITAIGGYAFVDCDQMTSVSVPAATSLGNYAFSSCGVLNSLNIPLVTSIGQYAFNACVGLGTIQGNSATSLGNYAFTGCSALASVDFPELASVGQYAFQKCTSLTSFDGENVTTVGTYAFTGCSALTEISLPKATSVAAYAFNACGASHISLPSLKSMTSGAFRGSRFTSVDLPNVTNIGNNAFRAQAYIQRLVLPKVASTASEAVRNCDALTYVDLPVCTSFGTYTFNDCGNLETLILRTTSKVCTMSNVNVLQLTKIANGEGYIYVPATMVDSYKSASNWSTYAAQIRAIESYPEITGG